MADIYWIRNTINNQIYVGSSISVVKRWDSHKRELKSNRHHSPILQHAWNKYGESNFIFEVILTCDDTLVRYYEQQFLDEWKPEYNSSPSAGGFLLGHVVTEETRRRQSARKIGRPLPREIYDRLSIRFSGSGNPSAKLTEQDVIEIRKRLNKKENQRSIAKDFNVTQALISKINRNELWVI